MTKVSDQVSLAGSAVDPAADLFPIVDMSEAGTARNKKITPDEVKIALDLDTSASPQFTALNLGHASDTTITRVSAGVVAIEGVNIVTTAGGVTFAADIVVPDEAYDATAWNGSLEVPTKNAVRDKIESLAGGVTTLDGLTDVNAPTPANNDVLTWDSTPGEWVAAAPTGGGYSPGGTDVALADGGTGASLVDPNADRIMFWDDSAGTMEWLAIGTNLSITGTTLNATGASALGGALVHKAADQTAANYSAGAVIAWDSEASGYDDAAYHDTVTNNSRITIPTTGKYRFDFNVEVGAATLTASEYARAGLIKNGSIATFLGAKWAICEISATVASFLQGGSAVISCTAGDYFEVWLDTESDTSITVAAAGSWFAVERVE